MRWRSELLRETLRLALYLLLGAGLGEVWGRPDWGLLAVLGAYSAWHVSQAVRMLAWLGREAAEAPPPESAAIWAVLFDKLYQQQRQELREREDLVASAQFMREATESMSDAVVMLDGLGAIIWCNRMSKPLLGIDSREDQGRLVVNLLRDPDFVHYLRDGNYTEPLEMKAPRNGRLQLRIEIIQFGRGNAMLYARDISKLRRLEQMRVDFIGNVSHELRTPLTVLTGYLETLQTLEGEEREQILDRALAQMMAQSARMEVLVSDLTMLSRLESLQTPQSTQVVDVGALVAMLVDDIACTVGQGKRFDVSIQCNRPLLGQEKEIHSAFGNLINNACKYSGVGGEIGISWKVEGGRAVFEVRDDGEGIAAAHIPRLTERFYRVDKSRSASTGGTGLGLAIVKHVLMRHQAILEIESEPGQGSVFRCLFPLERLGTAAA